LRVKIGLTISRSPAMTGPVGSMAAQLHAQGAIELLGISVLAVNEWLQLRLEVVDRCQSGPSTL
jgi:hypothetical protein